MSSLQETPPPSEIVRPASAADRAFLSLLVPGVGQFAQRRFLAGAGQLGTVLTYAATAIALGSGRALALAVLWNLWSAFDAYRHQRHDDPDER